MTRWSSGWASVRACAHAVIDSAAGTDNERFRSTWDILSTNEDRRGWTFVSSMESKKLPFYATQYHPERNA